MSTSLDPCPRATVRYNSSLPASFLPSHTPTSSSTFPPQTTSLSPDVGPVTSFQHVPRSGSQNDAYNQYVPQPQPSAAVQNGIHNDTYSYNDFDAMYRKRPQSTASYFPTDRLSTLPTFPPTTAEPTNSNTPHPPSLLRPPSSLPSSTYVHDSSKTTASNSRQIMQATNPRVSQTTGQSDLNMNGPHDNIHFPTPYNTHIRRTSVVSAVADKNGSSKKLPIVPSTQNALGMISLYAKNEAAASSVASPSPAKSKRVRTGCLTCRERHLKCDSPLTRSTFGVPVPDCFNCRKGNRDCKRGLRLNFIDIQVKPVPYFLPITEWNISFVDESRLIASEYVGGARRYPRVEDVTTEMSLRDTQGNFQMSGPHQSANIYTTNVHNASSSTPFPTDGHLSVMPQKHTPQRVMHAQQQAQDGSDIQTTIPEEKLQTLSTALDAMAANEEDERLSFYTGEAEFPGIGWYGRHASKSSDASSITSSMVPQGVGQSSTSSSQVEVGNSPGGASPRSITKLGAVAGTGLPNEAPEGLPTPPSETGRLLRHNAMDGRLHDSGDFDDIYGNNADTPTGEREYLDSPDEMLFMQAFVQNVGVWMDVLDKEKHFSRIIPFSALKSPMLLNAFLACGVKQLTLVNHTYKDDKALFYYNTATMILSRSLQNPDRNIIECATTAVVLHVYEIMSEKPNGRTSHITGARALIRECGWNASSKGIGAACFWLNISMEMLNCLAFNWPTAWDPDQWGLDLDFAADAESVKRNANDGSKELAMQESNDHLTGAGVFPYRRHSMETLTEASGPTSTTSSDGGDEEVWVHRIFYIVAKIANFRATEPRFQEPSPHDEQVRLQNRLLEWKRLKNLCDVWNRRCPRSMRPFGYLFPAPNESTSRFPNIWLVKRAAVVGRLFYHTAMVLLHQVNPIDPYESAENRKPLHHHAHQVCGIVAHNKDRGVAAVAIRCLAVSAMVLRDPREQDEVFSLFEKMSAETGWRIEGIYAELQQSWRRAMKRSDVTSSSPAPGLAPTRLPAPADLPPAPASLPPADVFAASKMGPGTGILAGHQFAALAPPFKPPCAPTGWTAGHPQATLAGPGLMAVPHTAPVPAASSAAPSGQSSPASAASLSQRATHMMNPLFHADFRLPDHPYKAFYRPPNDANDFNAQLF